MHILVIFTGGTIGSVSTDGWIAPDGASAYRLIEQYQKAHPSHDVAFEALAPYTVLSENVTAENINTLVEAVCTHTDKGFDGIIVTHGTDTLQYVASALSFAVGDALPVVFVSSNLPLESGDSNGNVNFEAAIDLIAAGEKGVFAVYRNNDGRVYYHLANRLLRHIEANDDLHSLFDQPFGEHRDGKVVKNPLCTVKAVGDPLGRFTLRDSAKVLNISAYPGDSFGYSLDEVKVILLSPFHSGTLNTESTAFIAFCQKARAAGIPIFLTNVPSGETYESSKAFDELGIVVLPPCATIPIYIKLWIAVSSGYPLVSFVKTVLNNEFL